MEKLYKSLVLFVGLTVLNLTAQSQQSVHAPYLATLNSYTRPNIYSKYLWNDVFYAYRQNQTINFINYPNPATTSTTIAYDLAAKANVTLKLIDLAGKQLVVLVKQQQNAGKQEYFWEFARHNVTSGMYILILQVDSKLYSRKIIIQ